MKLILDDGIEIPIEKVFYFELPENCVIVIEHPATISHQTINNIQSQIEAIIPRKCLVLSEGMTLKAVLAEQNQSLDELSQREYNTSSNAVSREEFIRFKRWVSENLGLNYF